MGQQPWCQHPERNRLYISAQRKIRLPHNDTVIVRVYLVQPHLTLRFYNSKNSGLQTRIDSLPLFVYTHPYLEN